MRTTLTLDPDVERLVSDEVHRVRRPFKDVINDALRRGLTSPGGQRRQKPYRLRPHAARLLPGIDRARLNALADEQEDVAVVGLARGRRRKTR
ncbi:MAG TPA: antitoxin [Vicinamibacteria bacterium]|nr:antitoxin [Vicinamibacteria bacterium]